MALESKELNNKGICKECGKPYIKQAPNQKICRDCRNKQLSIYQKQCEICNHAFTTNQPKKRYCSNKECKWEFRRRYRDWARKMVREKEKVLHDRVCVHCSKPFQHYNATIKFCSEECRKEYIKQNKPKPKYEVECIVCKSKFKPSNNTAKYCSDKCKTTPVNKQCKNCNKNFQIEFFKSYNVKYCSTQCCAQYNYKRKIPQKNEVIYEKIEDDVREKVYLLIQKLKSTGDQYQGKAIDYEKTCFLDSIKEQAKDRDGYTCQICGSNLNLEVHHMIKRRNGGDHSLVNLITLCTSCHRAVETGDQAHAIQKCTRNAFRNRHIPVQKIDDKLNKMGEKMITKRDLNEVFRLLTNDEKDEAMVILDRLIEIYES